MLKVEGLTKRLGSFGIDRVSFEVAAGDYFVLLGASGAGKTVVLELISGLLRPDAGCLWLRGADLTRVPVQKREMGLVYQDQMLFPHLTVRGNITYPLRCRRWAGNPQQRVHELARLVGAEHLLDRLPSTLSLGESQRVALARTLATNPSLLLLDEPLASLDIQARAAIRALLRRLHATGQTILHVTHDYQEAMALATRVAVLEDGGISQVGSPDEVFHQPRSRFVAGFVGIRNCFHGTLTPGPELSEFTTAEGVRFLIATESPGGTGCAMFESEAVTVSLSVPHGSARNVFKGRIVDVEPVRHGIELAVDIGVRLYATVTRGSIERMHLQPGSDVWISFKSTAVRYIGE